MIRTRPSFAIAWPTLGLIIAITLAWVGVTIWVAAWSQWMATILLAPVIALHASLQHEVIHGHPTPWRRFNEMLVFPAFTLVVPFYRYRESHLAHHRDAYLTDPYDDPESNYLDPKVWNGLPPWLRVLLQINNTLAGRLFLGPFLGTALWIRSDLRMCSERIARDWLLHIPAVVVVLIAVVLSPITLLSYIIAVYAALSILRLRTYLEHQAHTRASGRSVIVEDRGFFALLFLNNNLHAVHHMHPQVAWYDLPKLYRARKSHYLRRNGGYYYKSYGAVIRRHLLRSKDPVAHPLWPTE